MGKISGGDKFANQAVIACLESAANTLTFQKLETGVSLFDKVAWIINRIDYYVSALSSLNSATDQITWAITTTDQLTSLDMRNAAVIDYRGMIRVDLGAAASGFLEKYPIISDFSGLPSGGLIVPPNPIYLGVQGIGAAAAMAVQAKIFYTVMSLSAQDYLELWEARRMISSS